MFQGSEAIVGQQHAGTNRKTADLYQHNVGGVLLRADARVHGGYLFPADDGDMLHWTRLHSMSRGVHRT